MGVELLSPIDEYYIQLSYYSMIAIFQKTGFRHLKQGIQDFHRKYVLVPADKAANNVVVV